jgi:hypothetical protein
MSYDQFDISCGPGWIRWHKRKINWFMRQFRLTMCGAIWLAFAEGVVLTLILVWLID